MKTWNENLATLRATRIDALNRGDIDTLRTMLWRAGTFACLTIQTATATAERDFNEFVTTGHITNRYLITARTATIESLRRFVDTIDIDTFRRYIIDDASGWSLAEDIESNVTGLGCAKSSFTSALFGGTGTYCIDVWGARYAAIVIGLVDGDIDEYKSSYPNVKRAEFDSHDKSCMCPHHAVEWMRSNWKSAKNRWDIYRAIGDAAFRDVDGQWSFFASADPTFAETGHHEFFRHII